MLQNAVKKNRKMSQNFVKVEKRLKAEKCSEVEKCSKIGKCCVGQKRLRKW